MQESSLSLHESDCPINVRRYPLSFLCGNQLKTFGTLRAQPSPYTSDWLVSIFNRCVTPCFWFGEESNFHRSQQSDRSNSHFLNFIQFPLSNNAGFNSVIFKYFEHFGARKCKSVSFYKCTVQIFRRKGGNRLFRGLISRRNCTFRGTKKRWAQDPRKAYYKALPTEVAGHGSRNTYLA